MDLLRLPSAFCLFLFSISADDIRHYSAFVPLIKHSSLSGPLAVVPVPLVPVPVCCSTFFPFVDHNSLSGLLSGCSLSIQFRLCLCQHAVQCSFLSSSITRSLGQSLSCLPVCRSAFFAFVERSSLFGPLPPVPVPLTPMPVPSNVLSFRQT
jgi:hypothetical protein